MNVQSWHRVRNTVWIDHFQHVTSLISPRQRTVLCTSAAMSLQLRRRSVIACLYEYLAACSSVSSQKLKGSAGRHRNTGAVSWKFVHFENRDLAWAGKMRRWKSEDIGTDFFLIWYEGWCACNWVCVQTFPRHIEGKKVVVLEGNV